MYGFTYFTRQVSSLNIKVNETERFFVAVIILVVMPAHVRATYIQTIRTSMQCEEGADVDLR